MMTRGRKRKTKKLLEYYGLDYVKKVEEQKRGIKKIRGVSRSRAQLYEVKG